MMRNSSHVLMIVAAMAVGVSAGSVASAAGVLGFVAADSTNYVGRIAVITDPRGSSGFTCGMGVTNYERTVFINSGEGPAAILELGLAVLATAGTRLEIVSQELCAGNWKLCLRVVQPQNATPFLFTSTATATADNIGVITGQQDEDGFAGLVLTSKGSKPVFATLLTYEWLEPADRIVEIVELDYDPETGIALYGAFLQY